MMDFVRRRLQPAVRQGGRTPGFEGWYYKVQTAGGEIFAVIPGIILTEKDPHCFLQLLDSSGSRYLRFPPEAFAAAADRLDIRVGDSRFTTEGYSLHAPGIRAEMHFSSPVPYSARRHTLGIMGPFALLPGLECRHAVILADSRADGVIETGRGTLQVTGGRSYVEKDWGRMFPRSYVWCQAFWEDGTSFMLSAATVPLGGGCVRGMIAFLHGRNGWKRWATYTGAHVTAAEQKADGTVVLRAAAPGELLEVKLRPGTEGSLAAPTAAGMSRRIRESAAGRLELTVTGRRGNAVYHGVCLRASLEISGDTAALAGRRKNG